MEINTKLKNLPKGHYSTQEAMLILLDKILDELKKKTWKQLKMEDKEKIEKLKKAEKLIREITYEDLDADKIWLSHVFCCHGFLRDAIKEMFTKDEIKGIIRDVFESKLNYAFEGEQKE